MRHWRCGILWRSAGSAGCDDLAEGAIEMNEDFAHRLTLDRIRDGERIELVADDEERRAIADRLGLQSLDRLEAHACSRATGEIIRAPGPSPAAARTELRRHRRTGRRPCRRAVRYRFHSRTAGASADEEVELSPRIATSSSMTGPRSISARAIADTLALSLDPYPRSAGAEAALKEAGVLTEAEAGPFAGARRAQARRERRLRP